MTLERTYSGRKPATRVPAGAIDAHLHMYLPGYPARPGGPPLPPGLPGADEYRQVMDWLGIERCVIVQGNAHQRDNDCLLACLEMFGEKARGIAALGADASDAELERLHRAGVRGLRIMDLPGGAVGLDELAAIDARVSPLDWCLVVQFDGNHLLEHSDLLKGLRCRYTIDHHGKFLSGTTPDSAEVSALKSLLDRGNCWIKFAGCYETSKAGPPDYTDVAAVSRDLARHAPERIIWGSNWPHNMIQRTEDYPDDARLLDTVFAWLPDEAARKKALVDNPAELFDFD